MSRSPVLIVTDPSFRQLYGTRRFWVKGIKTSLKLFRRVIPVIVAESAGPDLSALAVEGTSRSPMAVIFPFRYLEGARLYKGNHAEIPVLVMGEGNPKPAYSTGPWGGEGSSPENISSLTFISTDTAADLYRAGLCASALAGEKQILLLSSGYFGNEYRNVFQEGLRAGNHSNSPVYAEASREDFSGIGCVIVTGVAAKFPEPGHEIPVILFSWADPAFCPRNVKLIFDDSSWALAAEALRAYPPPAGEILIASEPLLLPDRITEKGVFRALRARLSKQHN